MEEISTDTNPKRPYKTLSYASLWTGILAVALIVALMVASMLIGGGGSFEEGYAQGQAMGPLWGFYIIGSMLASFVLSIIALVLGIMSVKKENTQYRTLAIIGIILGSVGLSMFCCCGAVIVLGVVAAASQGM